MDRETNQGSVLLVATSANHGDVFEVIRQSGELTLYFSTVTSHNSVSTQVRVNSAYRRVD